VPFAFFVTTTYKLRKTMKQNGLRSVIQRIIDFDHADAKPDTLRVMKYF